MNLSRALREEAQIWQTVWQQVDTFIDRVLGARDDDASSRDRMRSLLAVAEAIETETRCRTGWGLLPPIERVGENVRWELTGSTAASEPELPVVQPAMRRRLPGAFDVEIAVAPVEVLPGITTFDKVLLVGQTQLFQMFDENARAWVPFVVPAYDFGGWTDTEAAAHKPHPDTGFFNLGQRAKFAVEGQGELSRWRKVRDDRTGNRRERDGRVDLAAVDRVLAGSATSAERAALADAAGTAAAACRRGRDALDAGAETLAATTVGPYIAKLREEFVARESDYDTIARLLAPGKLDLTVLGAVRGRLAGRGAIGAGDPLTQFENALDEVIDARVAYPDGTLRILRAMEWSLRLYWPPRKSWFHVREARRLKPLLDAFLEPFIVNLRAVVHGRATGLPFRATLQQPATTGALHLALTLPPGGEAALRQLTPGSLALLDGSRRALALLLRDESSVSEPSHRVRIAPLQVSLAGGASAPGIPGLVEMGAVVGPGPASDATSTALPHGEVPGHPEHDGVPLAAVGLWSRLSLLRGTAAITLALADGGRPAPALSALSVAGRLPVLAPVDAGANRLVLDVGQVLPVFDVDRPEGPPFARQGELLLLRGTDADGLVHQTAVEIVSIARTDREHVADETAMLARPVCCRGPGDRLVIQVRETQFEVPLVRDVSLHRDFRGFGGPTLAAERLLPDAVDSSGETVGEGRNIDRSSELAVAVRLLKEWTG